MGSQTTTGTVLIAEDDDYDRLLLNRAMQDCGVTNEVRFLGDGQELLAHLNHRLKSPNPDDFSFPCLILLDLNMPRVDGHEVLKIIKSDPELKKIPVVVLTTSKHPRDVVDCYKDGANSFFTKPFQYNELVELIQLLKLYWLQTAQLPCESDQRHI